MKTFWIYLLIFLILLVATQAFLYFSTGDKYNFDYEQLIIHIIIMFISALIVSYILRKKKNPYNEKTN